MQIDPFCLEEAYGKLVTVRRKLTEHLIFIDENLRMYFITGEI